MSVVPCHLMPFRNHSIQYTCIIFCVIIEVLHLLVVQYSSMCYYYSTILRRPLPLRMGFIDSPRVVRHALVARCFFHPRSRAQTLCCVDFPFTNTSMMWLYFRCDPCVQGNLKRMKRSSSEVNWSTVCKPLMPPRPRNFCDYSSV